MIKLGGVALSCLLLVACASAPHVKSDKRQAPSRSAIKQNAQSGKYDKLSVALMSGQDHDVEEAATLLLSKDGKDVFVLNALAMHHLRKSRMGLAKILLTQSSEIMPNSSTLSNNWGLVYLREGNMQKALGLFREAVVLDEKNYSAAANLGGIYASYGDCDRAIPHLENAYSNDYRPVDVLNNLAICWGSSKKASATDAFKQAMSRDPRNAVIIHNAAVFWLYQKNDPRQAAPYVRKLRELSLPRDLAQRLGQLEKDVKAPMGETVKSGSGAAGG